jgi:acyl carrier protein
MEQKFLTAFQLAIEVREELAMEDVFREHKAWDSLSHLSLIAMLDTEFGIQIENVDFEKMKTIRDVYTYVQKHSAK